MTNTTTTKGNETMNTETNNPTNSLFAEIPIRRTDWNNNVITDDVRIDLISKDKSQAWNFHFWTHATGRVVSITYYTKKEGIDHNCCVYPNTIWNSHLRSPKRLDEAQDIWNEIVKDGAKVSETIKETYANHVPDFDDEVETKIVNGQTVRYSKPKRIRKLNCRCVYVLKQNKYSDVWKQIGITKSENELNLVCQCKGIVTSFIYIEQAVK
jgi:hypothetical protein